MRSTAASSAGSRGPAWARKASSSGWWPRCQRAANRSAAGSCSVEWGSVIGRLVQSQLLCDAIDSAGELHAAGLGCPSNLGGDLRPGQAVVAQLDQPAFLFAEALAEPLEELAARD